MSPGLIAYVAIVLGLGGAALLRAWSRADASPWLPLSGAAFWFFLSLAAEAFWLETPSRRGMVSMSPAVNLATLFILPAHLVLTIGAASVVVADLLLHRRGWLRAAFNGTQTLLALFACLLWIRLFTGLGEPDGARSFLLHPLLALIVPATYFVLNTGSVAGAISLHGRISFWEAWKRNYGHVYQALSSTVLSVLGLGLVVAVERVGYVSGLLSVLFFLFIRDAYQRYVRARWPDEAEARA